MNFSGNLVFFLSCLVLMILWSIAGSYLFPELSIFSNIEPYEIFSFLLAPFWEEVIYRWLPYTLALSQERLATAVAALTGATISIQNNFMTAAWIGSSILFGIAHGDYPLGVVYQGVYGLLLFLMLAKSRNLLWAIALHLTWNLWVLGMAYIQS